MRIGVTDMNRILAILVTLVLLAGCDGSDPAASLSAHKRAWAIMGTTLEMTVYRPQQADAAADFDAAFAEIETIDRLMSLYRADSELSVLNGSAGGAEMSVSAQTREVLAASRHFWEISGGTFDVSMQPVIELWGFYDIAVARRPSESDIAATSATTGMDRVELSEGRVRLRPGTALDFGAIAKGYAVDRAVAALQARGASSAMINLGGTIGVTGPHPDGTPWRIGLQHPRDAALLSTVELSTGAVATSGDYDRFFEDDGVRYSHIIDPRTGRPVAGMASVSVIAPNATTADALSTAAFVLGADDGLALLNDCASVAGVVASVDSEGRIGVTATDSAGLLSVAVPVAPLAGADRACVWAVP